MRGSSKKTKDGWDYFKFHRRRDFFMSYINQVMILQCGPPSLHCCTFPKRPFFPLQFGQEENISGNSIERRDYWIILKIDRVLPVSTWGSRNRMMNTFIIVSIAPTCRQEIVYRINLCFLSTWKRPSFSLYLDTFFKEKLTDYCFILKVPLFLQRQSRSEDGEHFANDQN